MSALTMTATDPMAWTNWLHTVPALPGLFMRHVGLQLGWALVLAALASALLGTRVSTTPRRLVMGALALAALVPGPLGVSYWLGLSFQLPSLASLLWAACWIARDGARMRPMPGTPLLVFSLVLGMLLLLDTLALLPWAVHAWGFAPVALAVWLAGAVLLLRGTERWLALVLGALFVLTRLPSGNLWDALSDPWLMVVSAGVLVRKSRSLYLGR